MKASSSADKIDVLNQEVEKSKLDHFKERTTQLRQRFLNFLKREDKLHDKNTTIQGSDKKVEHQQCRCHEFKACHVCCFMKPFPTLKATERRPVIYNVKYENALYENRHRGFFKLKKERSAARHNYTCFLKDDYVQRSWESALQRHSDLHPIIYNNSLWTSTTNASRRIQNLRKASTCPRIERNIFTRTQKLTIDKQYINEPHRRTYYTVKKKNHVQLNKKSIAQWRF